MDVCLNKKKSNLESYALGEVYKNVTGKALSNAQCSLMDAKAQVTFVLSQQLCHIWKTKNSVIYISEMFTRKQKKEMDAQYEPQWNTHKNWQSDEKAGIWKPACNHQYLGGSQGGSDTKPAACLVDMATRKENPCLIADLFIEYVTVKDVFELMGRFTQHYACEEDVAPINANASSGAKKKEILQPCKETDSKARK